jgi:hypothetical protein
VVGLQDSKATSFECSGKEDGRVRNLRREDEEERGRGAEDNHIRAWLFLYCATEKLCRRRFPLWGITCTYTWKMYIYGVYTYGMCTNLWVYVHTSHV